MSDLNRFSAYIQDRWNLVDTIEKHLLDLQARYESFFQEICSVREHELQQLAWEINRRRGSLPEGLDAAVNAAAAKAGKQLDQQLAQMRTRHDALIASAEQTRNKSMALEAEIHQRNVDLDAREEALKARNEQLQAGIAQYNERIRQMGGGFGFLSNVFRLRSLQAERARFDQEQADVAAHIEALRVEWTRREADHQQQEQRLRQEWTAARTQAAALQAKIDHLTDTRTAVVARTALERVLFDRHPDHALETGPAAQVCPRCQTPNPAPNSFCLLCAQRLRADRPDLEGSLVEIAELNHHHKRFSDGMRGCQELIGLVRGLRCGLEAFTKSVDSMINSENRYPLAKLRIGVPPESVQFGAQFEGLLGAIDRNARHPVEVAHIAGQAAAVLTERNLQGYFECMGEELSRQAKAQWG